VRAHPGGAEGLPRRPRECPQRLTRGAESLTPALDPLRPALRDSGLGLGERLLPLPTLGGGTVAPALELDQRVPRPLARLAGLAHLALDVGDAGAGAVPGRDQFGQALRR
jgi:hypothetical protein